MEYRPVHVLIESKFIAKFQGIKITDSGWSYWTNRRIFAMTRGFQVIMWGRIYRLKCLKIVQRIYKNLRQNYQDNIFWLYTLIYVRSNNTVIIVFIQRMWKFVSSFVGYQCWQTQLTDSAYLWYTVTQKNKSQTEFDECYKVHYSYFDRSYDLEFVKHVNYWKQNWPIYVLWILMTLQIHSPAKRTWAKSEAKA